MTSQANQTVLDLVFGIEHRDLKRQQSNPASKPNRNPKFDDADEACASISCQGAGLQEFNVAVRVDGEDLTDAFPVDPTTDSILGLDACIEWAEDVADDLDLDFDSLYVSYFETDFFTGTNILSGCFLSTGCSAFVDLSEFDPNNDMNAFVLLPENEDEDEDGDGDEDGDSENGGACENLDVIVL